MESARAKTILVVEDEPDVRLYLQTALEDAGFTVRTAEDGVVALETIRAQPPGPKLFHELKRDPALSKIPVLIVTAHAKNQDVSGDLEQMLESSTLSGSDGGYLEKPVKALTYVRAVQRALGLDPAPEANDRVNLKEELGEMMRGASPEALRKALEALKKS
jgi:CheY-like chemotaxis protein